MINAVLVVGAPGAGTSAVAAALSAAGYHGGDVDAGRYVVDGHGGFERLDVVGFNERVLAELGWTWDTPPARPPSELPTLDEAIRGGRQLPDVLPNEGAPRYLKDPTMALLLPWWRRILLDRLVVVVPYRAATDVAWSLRLRHGFPIEVGLSLWAAYHRHMAAGMQGLPVIRVDYGALAERPQDVVPHLLTALEDVDAAGPSVHDAVPLANEPYSYRETSPDESVTGRETESVLKIQEAWATGAVSVHERFRMEVPAPSSWESAVLELRREAARVERQLVGERRESARSFAESQRHERTESRRLEQELASATAETARLEIEKRELEVESRKFEAESRRYRRASGRLALESSAGYAGLPGVMRRMWERVEGSHPSAAAVVAWVPRRLWRAFDAMRSQGLGAHPLFDPEWYSAEYSDARGHRRPWTHYRRLGAMRGYRPCQYFDPVWYRRRYPDVARNGQEPLDHYYRWGAREGRDPSPVFSTTGYLMRYPDVRKSGMNPLYHFMWFGAKEGRKAPSAEGSTPTATAVPKRNPSLSA